MKSTAPLEPAICVADMDRMMRFYREVLGLALHSDIPVPPEKSAPPGLAADGYRIVRLETDDGHRVKLVQPNRAAQPAAARRFVLDRQGFAFLTFLIADVAATRDALAAAGAEIMGEGKVFEIRDGVHIFFARDPEGNCLEFVQYADIGTYRPELAHAGRAD